MLVIKGCIFMFLFKTSISTSVSHFCQESYRCVEDCTWEEYYARLQESDYDYQATCMTTCNRTVCCTGYQGDKCDIPKSCSDVVGLPYLEQRARNYKADGVFGSDPYVNDQNLPSNWYRPTSLDGQYIIPDSNYIPENQFCGTRNPIYIKGDHPNITSLTNQPVQVTTCERNATDECAIERTIDIRACGEAIVYYLSQTSQDAAYCFDPPTIQGIKEFGVPTDIDLGTLHVQPRMIFQGLYLLPHVIFYCEEDNSEGTTSPSRETTVFYTYWYIDSDLAYIFENIGTIQALTEHDLIAKGYDLGINIRCGICVAKSTVGLKSQMVSSDEFFAGIKVDSTNVHIDKSQTAEIRLTPTIPYGCYGTGNGDCKLRIQSFYPASHGATCNGGKMTDTFHDSKQALCSLEFKGYRSDEAGSIPLEMSETKTMTLSAPYFSDSDPDLYRVQFITSGNAGHKIWKDHISQGIEIHVNNDNRFKKQLCYSHVDPHIKTPDGLSYDNHIVGSYILYMNTEYNIMVQEKTVRCNRNRASCACAVAVRAGADVFLIDLCDGKKFIGMTSCEDSGVLVVQKYSEFNYKVQTNLGTLVSIIIRPRRGYENLMNIDIHMSPKDYGNTAGLCGTLDGNSGNDYKDRSGNVVGRTDFVDSWRLGPYDVNLLEASCSHSLLSWEGQHLQMYCRCNCYDEDCSTGPNQNIACSPSPYFNCTFTRQKTDLCQDFHDRCTNPLRRKRSFSMHPEVELKEKAKRLSYRYKRSEPQTRSIEEITKESADEMCNQAITGSFAFTHFSNLTGGFNSTMAITECAFDVFEGQDSGWTEAYEVALTDAISVGFRRDEEYSLTHADDLKEFNTHSCPSSCSGHGTCSEEGICMCETGFFGPDCSNSVSKGPDIEDVEAGGLCDISTGTECRLFEIQTDYLNENFWCQTEVKRRKIDGDVETVETEIREGFFKNIFSGECSISEDRRKRSLDGSSDNDTMNYEYVVSLSNDGVNFGQTVTLYIFDSNCQNTVVYEDGTVLIEIKDNACLINGQCVNPGSVATDDKCLKCKPEVNHFHYTNDCTTNDGDLDMTILLLIGFGVVVGCVTIGILIIWLTKKACKPKRTISSMSGVDLQRSDFNAKIHFKIDNFVKEKY